MPSLSIWEKDSFYAPQDVIIVGAGLMGLWTAWELTRLKKNLRITIIERNPTPLGASTRNAGFACFGSPTELLHDANITGTDAMLQVAEWRYKGIRKIRSHFADAETGFDPCGGYEYINSTYRHWQQLDEKIDWLNTQLKPIIGTGQLFRRRDDILDSFGLRGFDALIENPTEAALHSGRLVTALIQKVRAAGVQVLFGIGLLQWEETPAHTVLYTDRDIRLTTQQLVFCTNGFTSTLLPALDITPARGQVLVTTPVPGLAIKGTFHFDEGFYYWRNVGNRILIGGARNAAFEAERTTDLSGSETVIQALSSFLRQHLDPAIKYEIDYQWSGIMGFTADKKPLLQKLSDRLSVVIACNGMGVALAPVIAEQAAAMVADQFDN